MWLHTKAGNIEIFLAEQQNIRKFSKKESKDALYRHKAIVKKIDTIFKNIWKHPCTSDQVCLVCIITPIALSMMHDNISFYNFPINSFFMLYSNLKSSNLKKTSSIKNKKAKGYF